MKLRTLLIIGVVMTALITSCKEDEAELVGNWVQKSYFDGYARAEGSSFAINDIGYFGMGRDDDGYLTDFWKFEPANNKWIPAANFPGTPRAYNVSISNGQKGYVGLGYDGTNDLADFWEYDAGSNSWKQIADFPGGERRYATAFAIGNDIYVGTGTFDKDKQFTNDFYKYDGSNWTKITSLPGDKRRKATATSLNGKGYVISGFRSSMLQDFWEYDPSSDSWTKLNSLNDEETGDSGIARQNAVAFASHGKIYITTGNLGASTTTSTFEWDPTADEWTAKSSLEGAIREGAGSFVLLDKGYVVGGRSGASYKDDTYLFEPSDKSESND